MAYISIGVFLLSCALLLWFFPDTSIFEYGYAEMNGFFSLVPFIFIFLVPALTMRSFAEERTQGTYVLLATRPLTDLQIVLAKYFAAVILVLLALLPTLVYYYSLYVLGQPEGNIDSGAVAGSYAGLMLLGAAFAAIGIFASSLSKSQVVAFVIAVFLCFFVFSGFEALGRLFELQQLGSLLLYFGMSGHYESMSRGVVDTRDVVYFVSCIALFLALTTYVIRRRQW